VEIAQRLRGVNVPFGVNLIVHRTNPRLEQDLAITVKHKVPLVITSLGAVKGLVDAVHSYGGVVFHDVIHLHHARKAAEAGVDGLITVCAGAGGHAGTLNPFAFLAEVRAFFDKTIILSDALPMGVRLLRLACWAPTWLTLVHALSPRVRVWRIRDIRR